MRGNIYEIILGKHDKGALKWKDAKTTKKWAWMTTI